MPLLELVQELPGHSEPAWQVAFNPSRPLLASCSTDKTVRLYSFDDRSFSDSLPASDDPKPTFSLLSAIETEHKRTIRSVAWGPDGRTLATGSFDSSVGIWEEVDSDAPEDDSEGVFKPSTEIGGEKVVSGAGEWECVTTLEGHESECKSVAFSSDGALLASCSRDKSVWVWEVQPDADFECIAVMMEHTQDVKCLAWHPKEEVLASASYDSHIHLMFDDPDGDWCIFQKLHPKLPSARTQSSLPELSPTADEKAIESLNIPPLEEDETVWCLAWSPCGRYLASGGDRGGIRIWRRKGNQPDSLFEEILHTAAHSRSVFSLSWRKGGYLASAGGDGKIIVWKTDVIEDGDGPVAPRLSMNPVAAVREAHSVDDVNSLSWCSREEGRGFLLASCGDDGGVKVWRLVRD
ncbi:WD40-repeat-containing domain protein [Kockovaella imperatae]|uniref:Probable cytosolic iron-sulfur protein assembly protein 1 n=1 Tax=Kockovaella imperatae TaxID=4999 RepID=A0A1Y1UFP3_9TREE|nr:WD40-repeat-containing domain protein [Kockovaella imperatae]ORX35885.1 WD40-repeat-containing domain protein [Kockovaella imperatae]